MKHGVTRRHRPIADLFELLGQRWTLRILWELRDGHLKFRALVDACGNVPSASLNLRVQELRRALLVEQTEEGYGLTAEGRRLGMILLEMNAWAKAWTAAGHWRATDTGKGE